MGKKDDNGCLDGCLWMLFLQVIGLVSYLLSHFFVIVCVLLGIVLVCAILYALHCGFKDIVNNKTLKKVAIITLSIIIAIALVIVFSVKFFPEHFKFILVAVLGTSFIVFIILQIIKSRNKQERQQKIDSPMKTPKGLMAIKTKYITDVIPYIIQVILVIAFFLLAFYFIKKLNFYMLWGYLFSLGIMILPLGFLAYMFNKIDKKVQKADFIKKKYYKAFHEFTSTNWNTDEIKNLPYITLKKVISYPESAWQEKENEITERERIEYEVRMRKQEEDRIRKEEEIRIQKEKEREQKRQEAISRRRKHNEKQEELYNAEIKEGKNLYYDIQRGLRDTLNTKYGLPYYYFYNYYPLSKYEKVSSINEDARHYIWHFKDGLNTKGHVHVLSIKINNLFGDNLAGLTFVCIPSSTKETYQKRYESFMENVCEKTGMQNGYDYVTITKEKTPSHLGGAEEMEYECDKEFFKGRKVIVFDDIITRGHSLGTMMEKLEIAGAQVIAAFFLGKTVDAYRVTGGTHPWCIDPANKNGIAFYEYGVFDDLVGIAIDRYK